MDIFEPNFIVPSSPSPFLQSYTNTVFSIQPSLVFIFTTNINGNKQKYLIGVKWMENQWSLKSWVWKTWRTIGSAIWNAIQTLTCQKVVEKCSKCFEKFATLSWNFTKVCSLYKSLNLKCKKLSVLFTFYLSFIAYKYGKKQYWIKNWRGKSI